MLRACHVQAVLGKGHKIKEFKLLDFSAIRDHLHTAKQIKRAATDGEKAAAKTAKEELMVSVRQLSPLLSSCCLPNRVEWWVPCLLFNLPYLLTHLCGATEHVVILKAATCTSLLWL